MSSEGVYVVTKIEAVEAGYRVTAKDADTTKAKRRNITSMANHADEFHVGQRVRVGMVDAE